MPISLHIGMIMFVRIFLPNYIWNSKGSDWKTKYLERKFSIARDEEDIEVSLATQPISKGQKF